MPDPSLNNQYPNYPQEFRFNYAGVPSSGTATISVRLKTFVTAALPNRSTTLTRVVNTAAPAQTLFVSSPIAAGKIFVLNTNDVMVFGACFSSGLTATNYNLFSVYVNGVLQPRQSTNGTPLYSLNPNGCSLGLSALSNSWQAVSEGTNVVQIMFTNQTFLSDSRSFMVVRPGDSDGDGMSDYAELIAGTNPHDSNSVLRITSLADGNQLIVWDSVSNVNYRVLATTNLSQPMVPISPIIPATGASTFFFDNSPPSDSRFYRVQVVP